MNVPDFSYLLQKPESIGQDHVESLKKIIDEYPFFQAARAVYLKALRDRESFKYNSELKVAAAYTTDRSILFEYITSPEFKQHAIAKKIAIQSANEELFALPVEAEEIIIRDNKTSFDFNEVNSNAVMDPELFQPKEEKEEQKEVPEKEGKGLQLGKPLEFSKKETHSFMEWMQLSSTAKPIDRKDDRESTSEEKKEKQSAIEHKLKLIDKFIENNPKIPPVGEHVKKTDLTKEQKVEKSELMTETLARVYLEQKKFKKAIKAYKILSLKYPEKSGFFADQINAIKKVKESN
ncbi:hypothetical protein OOZ15_08520 [Galbibacter sp. EGI 63066]|uniref:hypothetical protein n=1 Tax=Galbibacter sp. EGI 63066 TaxID=2993559 RepID=UPI002248E9BF|nr:hypothetical protein [Galbibacter sp. EGI 63066]MCX2679977.1 hypothetical protein [Galbibacter sp. EGI 63066]